jgi:ketosteroid isomerase-like protein
MCGLALNLESEPLLEDPLATPGTSPTTQPPGQHHYHHHYHHHYFASGGELPSAAGAGQAKGVPSDSGLRDARLRAPGAGQVMSRTETAVRKVTFDWALACNNKQLDDLVSTYSNDAMVLRPNHPPVRGTAAIREYFFSVLDAGLGEVELEPLRVDILGDVAYEAGRCKMLVPVVVGKRREERGKYMTLLAKQANGEWRIVADCWSSDLSLISSAEGEVPKPAASSTLQQKPIPPRK